MPCVLELLEAGAHLEKSGPGTALHMATTNDREACVRALIKEGANVDALSCRGHTPLVIHDIACSGTIYYMTRSSPAFCSTRMPIPSAAVWSMPLCRVLWFFSINYLRKKSRRGRSRAVHRLAVPLCCLCDPADDAPRARDTSLGPDRPAIREPGARVQPVAEACAAELRIFTGLGLGL